MVVKKGMDFLNLLGALGGKNHVCSSTYRPNVAWVRCGFFRPVRWITAVSAAYLKRIHGGNGAGVGAR